MATLKVPSRPSTIRDLRNENMRVNNMRTVNILDDNMRTNPYITYSMAVKVDKLKNRFVEKPAYEPSALQQQMDKRMEYSFDYNNPNQVNSAADVIMRTLVNIGGTMRGVKTADQTLIDFGTDTYNLFYKGTWQPLINKDWGVLLANQFVNFRETVDLVDNVWKGFAIGGGLAMSKNNAFKWEDAKEGMRRAVVDRENFDFDTGSKGLDMALEMATPTNLALLGLGIWTGGAGAAAAKEAGEEGIKKGLVKSFGKHYTSKGLDATFKAMGKNLTAAEITSLTNISKHIKNLQVLSSVNKFKKAIDIVDKIGPQLAIKTTVGIPWGVIKATSGATNSVIRYFATAVEEVQASNPRPGVISTLFHRPEYELLFDNLAKAQEVLKEKQVTVVFDDVISGVANSDNNVLKNLYDDFYKTATSKKLIEQYIEQIFQSTGKYTPFDLAQQEFSALQLDKLVDRLNKFAFDNSGEMYKTFEEYANVIHTLNEVSGKTEGMKALSGTIANIETQMHRMFMYEQVEKVKEVIGEASGIVKRVKVDINEMKFTHIYERQRLLKTLDDIQIEKDALNRTGIEGLKERTVKRLSELDDLIADAALPEGYKGAVDPEVFAKTMEAKVTRLEGVRTSAYKAYQKAKKLDPSVKFDPSDIDTELANIPKRIHENLVAFNKEARIIEQHNALIGEKNKLLKELPYFDKALERWGELDLDEIGIQQKIDALRPSRIPESFVIKTIDPIEPIEKLIDFSVEIDRVLDAGVNLTETHKQMYKDIQEFIDYSIDKILRGVGRTNLSIQKGVTKIDNYGVDLLQAFTDIQAKLDALPFELLYNNEFGAGLKQMSNTMYGKSILSLVDNNLEKLRKHFGNQVRGSFKEFVEQSFYENGAIKEVKYEKFMDDLDNTLRLFSDEMFEYMGEGQSDSLTYADMTFEFKETVIRLRQQLMDIRADYHMSKIDPARIGTTLDELDTLKYNINRTMKAVNSHLEHAKQTFNLDPKNVASVQKEVDLATGDTVDKIHKVLFGEISTPESIGISRRVWVYVTNSKLDQHVIDPLEKYAALKRKGGVMTADELSQLKNTEPFIKHLYEWLRFVDNANIRSTKLKKLQRQADNVFDFKAAIEAVEGIEKAIGYTADIELKFSKDILTEYSLKMNTTLKNMHLLQNKQLLEFLEAVRAKDYARMPILESLEGMSRYQVGGLREITNTIGQIDFPLLKQAIQQGNQAYVNDIIFGTTYTDFNKMYIEYFGKAFDPLTDNVGEFLEAAQTILEVQKSAEIMMDTLYGMVSVVEFYDSVNLAITKGLDQTVANTFLDAIQRTYDKPASLITLGELRDNPELLQFEYKKIFENMELQLRNQSSPYNLKLSNWYDWFSTTGEISKEDLDIAETLFGANPKMKHTASFDAWSDHIIHKYLLQDGEAANKYFAVDIEASGLNKTTSTIFQKSVFQPETGIYKWYINTGVADHELPDEDDLYHLLFGDGEGHVENIDDLKTLFRKIYQNDNKAEAEATLRDYFDIGNSPIEIIMASNEAELLKMSSEFIETQKPPRGKLMYRMHNGLGYDMPLINNRAKYNSVKDVRIGAHKLQDTQLLLEEALGVRKLTAHEIKTVEELVFDHIIRRNAELSVKGLKRQVGNKGVKINENLSKFLPTMDKQYMEAHDKLIEIFEDVNPKAFDADRIATEIAPGGMGSKELMRQFTETTSLFYLDLKDLDKVNRRLNQYRITVNANDITRGNRILPADYGKNIPKDLLANHIGMDLAEMNTVNGVYIPIMGVNKHSAPNLAVEYFDTGGNLVTDRNMKQMTQLAGNVQKTMSYINNPHAIDAMDINSIHQIHDLLIQELKQFAGESYFDPILGYLKKGETNLRSFATTYELWKTYNRLSNGTIAEVMDENGVYRLPLMKALLENPETSEVAQHLVNTKELFKNSLSEYGMDKKFFTMEPKPGDAKAIWDYWGNLIGKNISTLSELEEAQDLLQLTRLKRVAAVYRGMQDSFNTFHQVAENTVINANKLLTDGLVESLPANLENATYSTLRIITESYDSLISFSKLQQVLEFTPEQLASYLRHQAKGGVIFQNSSLSSANYFPRRGLSKMRDIIGYDLRGTLDHLMNQKEALEKLGIAIVSDSQETIIHVTDIAKLADAKYVQFANDFDMSDWIKQIVDAGLSDAGEVGDLIKQADYDGVLKALQEVDSSRANLTKLMPDANTSTLEVLDEIAMERILEKVSLKVKNGLDLATMEKYAMFEGNSFNHTVLGHIDGRRAYMDYASFNPAKTMYNATEMVEKHLGAQVQLLELVQTPEFKLENFVGEGKMSPKEIITYLKQSHLKVAFLNDKSTPDMPNFKLAAVTINNKKDLDFALRMGATVIDTQSYNEAYKIINNYKIRNSVANFFDKVFVMPFKLGWMAWNYGVVARNYVDTITKNITTTKDMAIIPIMAQMHADYGNYKNVLIDIYKYGEKQNVHVDVAIDEFFAKNADKLKITKEAFDTIAEYKLAGGGVSMPKEILEHYGDSIDRMFKNVKEEQSGLSKTDFRHMMEMPDDVAEQWLLEKFPTDLARVEMLMGTKYDLLTYKRAYAMHKAYKGSGLTVNDLVTYLKSGRIDPRMEPIALDLMEKTKHVVAEDSMFNKIMSHPFIANSLDWNMASEEILRLSMFKYMKDTGYNTVETMGEIARTHFDYGKKHWAQLYLEMAMPFSTFKMMSLMYWVEEMSNNAGSVEILADAWANLANLPDRQPEDAMLRRNLRYQMYTGNMVLNEETGLTAKINPTPIDMMNFFMNPVEYVDGMLHSGFHAAKDLLQAEPYENESELSFYKRKQRLAFDLVPYFGGNINKIRKAYEDARPKDEKGKKQETEPASMGQFILNLVLSPLFNTTWTPEQGGEWRRFGPYEQKKYRPYQYQKYQRYRPSRKYGGYKKYGKRYYPKRYYDNQVRPISPRRHKNFTHGYTDWSRYSTYNKTMNMPQFKFSRGSAYPTKASRSLNYAFSSVWRRSMTKKGNAKFKFLGFPTNKWTLKIKIQMLRNITSYNRWA